MLLTGLHLLHLVLHLFHLCWRTSAGQQSILNKSLAFASHLISSFLILNIVQGNICYLPAQALSVWTQGGYAACVLSLKWILGIAG